MTKETKSRGKTPWKSGVSKRQHKALQARVDRLNLRIDSFKSRLVELKALIKPPWQTETTEKQP